MKKFRNRTPLSTYFNNPEVRKSINDLLSARKNEDEKKVNELNKVQKKMAKKLSKDIDKIITPSIKRKFIAEKEKLSKPYKRETEFNSEFLNTPSRIRLKNEISALCKKYEIDLNAIAQLKNEYNKSLRKLFFSTVLPESKPAQKTRKIKKNRDYLPPYYSNARYQHENDRFFVGTNGERVIDANGFSDEQSGHIYLKSVLGIDGARDSDSQYTILRQSFLIKFQPTENGRLWLNFRQFVHNRSITTYNYNEPGWSYILSHLKETIPVVTVGRLDGGGGITQIDSRRLEEASHRISTIPSLDSLYHSSENHVRRESDYFLISDNVSRRDLLIIEFELYMYHWVDVDDVSYGSFVSEHHEIEKIGVLVN